jgi:hypothetical protein
MTIHMTSEAATHCQFRNIVSKPASHVMQKTQKPNSSIHFIVKNQNQALGLLMWK